MCERTDMKLAGETKITFMLVNMKCGKKVVRKLYIMCDRYFKYNHLEVNLGKQYLHEI